MGYIEEHINKRTDYKLIGSALILFFMIAVSQLPLLSFGQSGYDDSLAIFNKYKSQIDSLRALSKRGLQADYDEWYKIQDFSDSGVSCALVRLKKLNGKPYEPIKQIEVEGFGIAKYYPSPDSMYGLSFTVIHPPTRFILKADGKTIIPYVEKWYYTKEGIRIGIKFVTPISHTDL